MFLYVLMAGYAGIGWAFNARLASMMATSLSVTGAMFTFLSLVTGSFWGKPTWGTWWVWDARLTSELILLFLYIGFMALQAAIDDPRRADHGLDDATGHRRDEATGDDVALEGRWAPLSQGPGSAAGIRLQAAPPPRHAPASRRTRARPPRV